MYTKMKPLGQSIMNYVAFLWIEAGQPWLEVRLINRIWLRVI
jgi:hypothetical protein